MSPTEKTTFGASVEPITPIKTTTHLNLTTPLSIESLSPSASHSPNVPSSPVTPISAHDPSNPFSAFYSHPTTRRSLEQQAASSKTQLDTYNHDLEAGSGLLPPPPLSTITTQHTLPKSSIEGRPKECTVWPSKQTLREKAHEERCQTGNPIVRRWRNMDNRQRLWFKIVIALLVIAAAVGIGIGISRAVGGGVWAGQGKSKEIPSGR
ncbi:hypothetical protein H2201_001016 [Coniosporium apollinis]|uniref:Uncharacterized protein n=1 Tax=Coniosporium apollinis TaxID=61459 RepID=A0ABQ9P461_9PEZI|nr:hypothetical protein H2201_001016 [Coniosporium apollinis]